MDWLIHLANLLFLMSYLVRDILMLRLLSIVAGSSLLGYLATRPIPDRPSIGWGVLSIALNIVQIGILVRERRPVRLTFEQQNLYALGFRCLTPREFLRLLAISSFRDIPPDGLVVDQGVILDRLLVLVSGTAQVHVGGPAGSTSRRIVADLREGHLVGEMSYLTESPTSAQVIAKDQVRLLELPRKSLSVLLQKHPNIRAALQNIIGQDLVGKLRAR